LIASFAIFRVLSVNVATSQGVLDSTLAINHLNTLLRAVIDAETAERGYVITGNPTFLEPYQASITTFHEALRQLEQPVTPGRHGELEATAILFDRWRTEVAGPVIAARHDTPVGMAVTTQRAYTSLLSALHAEAAYFASGEPAFLTEWRSHLTDFRRHVVSVLTFRLPPDQISRWQEVTDLASRYETEVLTNREAGTFVQKSSSELEEKLLLLAEESHLAEEQATALIQAGAGKVLVDEIRAKVAALERQETLLLEERLDRNHALTTQMQFIAFAGPVGAVVLSLIAILGLQFGITRAIGKLVTAARALSEGKLTEPIEESSLGELALFARAFNVMADKLAERERQANALAQMGSLLQTCKNSAEAYAIVQRFAQQLLKGMSGTLSIISASRNMLQPVVSWAPDGSPEVREVFEPEDCWALRLGRLHRVKDPLTEMTCSHTHSQLHGPVQNGTRVQSLCIPLTSQDEPIGVLSFYLTDPAADAFTEAQQHLAISLAEQLALALANLKLREILRNQSIRDPLTGLFNRRYLDETLDIELHRAGRKQAPLSIIMFDIDHFKRFNDTFGHDAGDYVLREVGALLKRTSRGGDIPCRYGGEEFLLILPETGTQDATMRAERLRGEIKKLTLRHQGQALGDVSFSLGVATYPHHAVGGSELVSVADAALYQAKREGRDRVVTVPVALPVAATPELTQTT
jgi:diguanylate cyclase (GGDEF)-like protein